MQRWILFILACALFAPVAFADPRLGKQVRFVGIHPIPKSEGGGICYIEGPHVHIYAANKLEYRDHGGDHYFVGDPVAYGFDGPRYAYKGPHPIQVEAVVGGDPDVEYCYIEGPHFHYFAPPDGPDFKVTGDAYFYVGQPPHAFVEARPAYVGINAYYRPFVYERPVVTVDAPVGWIGARAEFVTPGVVVGGPGVVVGGPGLVVGGPGVVVGGPGVAVGAEVHVPMPSVHVGVGIDLGGPGVIVHDQRHDNGRHEGWHKGHR